MSYPIKKKDVIWRRVGDTIVVIKEDGLSSHILNKTAAFIWELCDGTLDTSEIANKMHERFDVSLEVVESDVNKIIDELIRAGIMNTAKGTRIGRGDSQ